MQGYSEDDWHTAIDELSAIVVSFNEIEPEFGFKEVEKVVDSLIAWWDAWICPISKAGYLGFWSIFEDGTELAEAIEKIGGIGTAGFLQMSAFLVWIKRVVLDVQELIQDIGICADKDSVEAIETARRLVESLNIKAGVILNDGENAGPDALQQADTDLDAARDLAIRILDFMQNSLGDEELIGYINYEGLITIDAANVERAKKVACLL